MNVVTVQRLAPLSEADLSDFRHLMPETVRNLVSCIGAHAALALLNAWPGVEVKVPLYPNANPAGARRWSLMAEIVGEVAMQLLSKNYGGTSLVIPTCKQVRDEKRNRLIRHDFDHLTAKPPNGLGLSKSDAIQEVGMRHAPISARAVESILNRPAL
ncbi:MULTISPECIES: Mor transcription activator family protein [unclassified Variovorax]|uniref:Mor transcription activator family protein n=1 Tax=unclassified Variovorax TaxID=663243 RepID=UPI0032E5DA33